MAARLATDYQKSCADAGSEPDEAWLEPLAQRILEAQVPTAQAARAHVDEARGAAEAEPAQAPALARSFWLLGKALGLDGEHDGAAEAFLEGARALRPLFGADEETHAELMLSLVRDHAASAQAAGPEVHPAEEEWGEVVERLQARFGAGDEEE